MTSYTPETDIVTWAYDVARDHLAEPLPRRWTHVRGVVELAREVAPVVADDPDMLIAAAALHDIGWSPAIRRSTLPALDAARRLEQLDAPARLVGLVANYDFASLEARYRGLAEEHARYADERTPTRDALWYCDLRVGPDGQRMTVSERFAELFVRYAADTVGKEWFAEAEPELRAACDRTDALLTAT
ncbi:HD domain-containing protein [Pseudonocardia spinosispora]|uniref:HD domain-containing protein n=1 Tax=Pseudonocardia spinosispora TaxID=103441 RepID=UPI0003F9899E|nr:HD domain-containing protein [Pseudonocardia spinosispora]